MRRNFMDLKIVDNASGIKQYDNFLLPNFGNWNPIISLVCSKALDLRIACLEDEAVWFWRLYNLKMQGNTYS